MARPPKNLPVDHKWGQELGPRGKNHRYTTEGEYEEVLYEHVEYPKFIYHADYVADKKPGVEYSATQCSQLVKNADEREEFGPDWKDSPAEFGMTTAPSEDELKRLKVKAAQHAGDWKSAIGAPSQDITDHHVEFLQAHGRSDVTSIAQVYSLLASFTSAQMSQFMTDAAKWKPKKGKAA